jgi:hypothetical protein
MGAVWWLWLQAISNWLVILTVETFANSVVGVRKRHFIWTAVLVGGQRDMA